MALAKAGLQIDSLASGVFRRRLKPEPARTQDSRKQTSALGDQLHFHKPSPGPQKWKVRSFSSTSPRPSASLFSCGLERHNLRSCSEFIQSKNAHQSRAARVVQTRAAADDKIGVDDDEVRLLAQSN
jgi:hypothetical protein